MPHKSCSTVILALLSSATGDSMPSSWYLGSSSQLQSCHLVCYYAVGIPIACNDDMLNTIDTAAKMIALMSSFGKTCTSIDAYKGGVHAEMVPSFASGGGESGSCNYPNSTNNCGGRQEGEAAGGCGGSETQPQRGHRHPHRGHRRLLHVLGCGVHLSSPHLRLRARREEQSHDGDGGGDDGGPASHRLGRRSIPSLPHSSLHVRIPACTTAMNDAREERSATNAA
ncbi:hypothetical protein T492DRAFT_1116892 [Pavlovales sp. CCMP2436]|nr:hypothetical protein T492DRAFT_1116892 [Pavlovales sp. CCMP2436]